MGRTKTMTKEDKQAYCREYYYKTRNERAHEYLLVSKRAYLRKKLKSLCPNDVIDLDNDRMFNDVINIRRQIETINAELKPIREARWNAKRAEGKALFKHFSDDDARERSKDERDSDVETSLN